MAIARFKTVADSNAAGMGWSLTSYPNGDRDRDDARPRAVATEMLYRPTEHGSLKMAYRPGDEYLLEEEHELVTIDGEPVKR